MYIIIAGGGTIGREIAKALPEHEITVIEKDQKVCVRDCEELNATVINGDCTLNHVLKQADIDKAGAVIAVTNNDEVNLLMGVIAKRKGKQVVVRVKEPEYVELFKELGIENIISPERRAALDIAKKVVFE